VNCLSEDTLIPPNVAGGRDGVAIGGRVPETDPPGVELTSMVGRLLKAFLECEKTENGRRVANGFAEILGAALPAHIVEEMARSWREVGRLQEEDIAPSAPRGAKGKERVWGKSRGAGWRLAGQGLWF